MPTDALQFLPPARWVVQGGSGRTPAEDINDMANDPRETTVTVTARGALLPVLYGRRDVPGMVFAVGTIGSDLVIGYMWCVGEIDAIEALYLNDAAVPGGVTVTHYTGTTTQTADATLQAAIAGYNDSLRFETPSGLRGIAYSVVRIPNGTLDGFPRARAVMRGMKHIHDPRTDSTGYTDNAALCTAHYIKDPDIGAGSAVVGGLEACADWCDSLLGGASERARIALLLMQGRPVIDYIRLLAEYAECFFVPEGEGYRLIPDAPVDLSGVPTVTAADILENSLEVEAVDDIDVPTEIEIQYLDPPDDATQPWATIPAEPVALPGVAEGDVRRIPTSVSLEGVYRFEEAANKALSRLYRQQNRQRVRWQALALAVRYQKGDVVQIEHAARGVSMPVRIMQVDVSAAGRHTISAERYDASHYPNDLVLPSTEGTVPVGAIGFLMGETVPDGWALWTDADDRYLRGAGSGVTAGSTGGSDSVPEQTGSTATAGAHDEPEDMPVPKTAGSISQNYRGTGTDRGGHSHSYTVASWEPNLYRLETPLVVKTGSPAVRIPASVAVLGLPNLAGALISKITTYAGRYVRAAGATAAVGSESLTKAATVASASDSHTHTQASAPLDSVVAGPEALGRRSVSGGGSHTHTATLSVTANLRRQQVCMFGGSDEYPIYPGVIVPFKPGEAVPTDWVLCDGANGTPDLRNRLLQLAGATPAAAAGDDTLSLSGSTNQVGHHHDGGQVNAGHNGFYYAHKATVYHAHSISRSLSWAPAWFAVDFIMYAPGS